MLDPLIPFIDPIVDPIVELSEDNTCFVIQAETFFDFIEKTGLDKMAGLPEGANSIFRYCYAFVKARRIRKIEKLYYRLPCKA
ncbi:MAG: hypothetical protein ACJ8CB_10785 [Ktedonobacteraceae bacterium]